jgi:hypothetical protein
MDDDEGMHDIWLLDATSLSGYAASTDIAHPETLVHHTIGALDIQVGQTLETHPFPYFLRIVLLPRRTIPSHPACTPADGIALLLPLQQILNITIADHASQGQILRFKLAPARGASWVLRQIMTENGPGRVYGPNEEDPYRLLGMLKFRELAVRNSGVGGDWVEVVAGWAGCLKRNAAKHHNHTVQVLREDAEGQWSMMDTSSASDGGDDVDEEPLGEDIMDLKVEVDEDPMDANDSASTVECPMETIVVVALPPTETTGSLQSEPAKMSCSSRPVTGSDIPRLQSANQKPLADRIDVPSHSDKIDANDIRDGTPLSDDYSYSDSPDNSPQSEPDSPPHERNERPHHSDNRETSPDEPPFSREPSDEPVRRRQYKRPRLSQNESKRDRTPHTPPPPRQYQNRQLTGSNSIEVGSARFHPQQNYNISPQRFNIPQYRNSHPQQNPRYHPYQNYPPPRYRAPNTQYHSPNYRGPRRFDSLPPGPRPFTPRFRQPYSPQFPIRHINNGYDSYRPGSSGSPGNRDGESGAAFRDFMEKYGTKRKPRIERRE